MPPSNPERPTPTPQAGQHPAPTPDEAKTEKTTSAKLREEISRHRTAYTILALSTIGGIALVPEIFPEATALQGAFGGACLGTWAALSSSAGKFFGD
jgi:hypothetical protein